ncbi:MAG: NUDIX hydrolase [Nocardioidaceae bacterium]
MGAESNGQIEAAGGVLWRQSRGSDIEIALVHRPKYDDWSLPKGKLSSGEHVLAGAVREVQEETGFTPMVGPPLGQVHYDKDGSPKRVRYWAMRATDGTFDPTTEVDDLRWVRPAEGMDYLAADRDRPVLAGFLDDHVETRPCLLVRHGSAGDRGSFPGDDRDRPLDERGQRQAETLQHLLALYHIDRVVSADVLRCLDTVAPYACTRRVGIETEPLVSEAGFVNDRTAAVDRLVQILGGSRPTVVCSQGKAIPGLLAGACRTLRGPTLNDTSVRKGGFWVVHLATTKRPRIAALERFDSPE